MFKFRELVAAGAFVQRAGTAVPSSLTGLNVGSSFSGNSTIRGITTMNSGTTVVSVTATGIVSGDVILTGIIGYVSAAGSQQVINTCAESVRAGAFEIRCVGSVAPISNMGAAWFKIS